MIKRAYEHYYFFILCISVLSNFFKMFFPTSDYIFGVALCLACFALNVYLLVFRDNEGEKLQLLIILFFILSILLLAVELISLEQPIPSHGYTATYRGPHQNKFTLPYPTLLFIYNFNIIWRVICMVNSVAFSVYYTTALLKQKSINILK